MSVIARFVYIGYMLKKQLKEKGLIKKDNIINDDIKEGFESLESCLWQGYPTRFCKEVPIQSCLTNCGENCQ